MLSLNNSFKGKNASNIHKVIEYTNFSEYSERLLELMNIINYASIFIPAMQGEKMTSIENYINNYNISFDVNDKMHSLVLPPMESFSRPQENTPAAKMEQVVPKMEEITPPDSPACSEASSEEECPRPTTGSKRKHS